MIGDAQSRRDGDLPEPRGIRAPAHRRIGRQITQATPPVRITAGIWTRFAKTRISSSRCFSSCSKNIITLYQIESASITPSRALPVQPPKAAQDGEANKGIQCEAFGVRCDVLGRGPPPRKCFRSDHVEGQRAL